MRQKSNRRLSVVIQGPVIENQLPNKQKTTDFAIKCCRKVLPKSEIILSTWEGSDTSGLAADKIIFNKDPGPQGIFGSGAIPSNVNRQIVSSANGIKSASENFVLKLRSDAILLGANFIDIFDTTKSSSSMYKIFERKVVSNNLSSKNPATMSEFPLLYHPADHAHFGLRNDLLTLWDLPLQSEDDSTYFTVIDRPNTYRNNESSRFTPEQFICIQSFRKSIPINIESYADISEIDISEKALAENFVFVNDADFSFYIEKYHNYLHEIYKWMRYDGHAYQSMHDYSRLNIAKHFLDTYLFRRSS